MEKELQVWRDAIFKIGHKINNTGDGYRYDSGEIIDEIANEMIEAGYSLSYQPVDDQRIFFQKVMDRMNSHKEKEHQFRAKYNSPHSKIILARKKEGFTIDDMYYVIDLKWNEWKGTKMEKYFRPETLFSQTKFPGYVAQKPINAKSTGAFDKLADSVAAAQRTALGGSGRQ